ncbi:hypothetical protein D3C77_503910 [compost metagenome]
MTTINRFVCVLRQSSILHELKMVKHLTRTVKFLKILLNMDGGLKCEQGTFLLDKTILL